MGPGTVNAGGVVSLTVMVKAREVAFPAASAAVHATVVAPMAKVAPDAGEQTGTMPAVTVSDAEATKVTTVPVGPAASAVMGPGSVSVGAIESPVVTAKDAVPVLPARSVAVQVTVVAPMAKVAPDAGVQTTAIAPSTTSLADAA
jgi:hypothetical protein